MTALAALLLALTSPPERPPQGVWVITKVERAPWATGAPNRSRLGQRLRFGRGKVTGARPFACTSAAWQSVQSPPEGLFQGNLPPGKAAGHARRLGLPNPAQTLRLDCSTGSFDFHRTATGLITALDNDLLRLEPARR